MLPFTVEFRSGEPVYEQVLYAVKKAVVAGQFSPGDRFPSVRALSQELRINPNTAHKIVAALTADGVLHVQPGIGTVIAPPVNGSTEDRAALLNDELERLLIEARRLGLDEEKVVAAVRKHWRKFPKTP
ncbi:GntR family transcriptional regulator [Oleiharenicola lentus]|uniref:GntR family transcriptional regulator n=1 Tax=Oleiharenicola lentus TaxID=2508720 RepID=UPI003F673FFE